MLHRKEYNCGDVNKQGKKIGRSSPCSCSCKLGPHQYNVIEKNVERKWKINSTTGASKNEFVF